MNLKFLKLVSVLLLAGPEINAKIQDVYDLLVNLYARMNGEIAEAAGVDRATTMVESHPEVASLCDKCEMPRMASGSRRPNGFFADLIGSFNLEDLKKAIDHIIAIAILFGFDLNMGEKQDLTSTSSNEGEVEGEGEDDDRDEEQQTGE